MPFPLLAVALIIGVLGIAMALLMPKPHIENARASKLSDFSFPRSQNGDPVPLMKGTSRLRSPNTIALGGFHPEPITVKVATGLFSSKKQIVGYKYYVTLGLAFALGPNARIKRIWFGKYIAWTGDAGGGDSIAINLPELLGGKDKNGGIGGTIRIYGGEFDQGRDPKLASVVDPNVPAWPGMAYLVFDDFYFGNSTSIEPINIEVQCFSDVLGLSAVGGGINVMPNGLDENPIETLADIIATKFARLGFTTGALDVANFTEAATIIHGENNGGSWEIARPNRGADLMREILRQIEATVYQDPQTGLIKIKLIREDYDIDTLPLLDPTNITQVRNLSKTLWNQTTNQVRIKFRNRDNQYADDAAQDQDFANINWQNKIRSTELLMPGVYRADLANQLAARERAKVSIPLFALEIECNREEVILRPGDPFKMAWPQYNIAQIVMRVRTFDLGAWDKGKVTIIAGQDEFAANDVIYADPSETGGIGGSTDPAEITQYAAIECPLWLLRQFDNTVDSGAFVLAIARAPSTYSLSYDMVTSDDAFATYATALDAAIYDGAAVLNGAYGNGTAQGSDDGYDSGVTGLVIDGLDGKFTPESGATVSSGEGLILVSGTEVMGYETVADLGGNSFRLTNIRRALLDTEAIAHADNATVVFLSGIDGLYEHEFSSTGSVTLRLLDHTNRGTFDVADAADIVVNFDQRIERPSPPDYATAGGVRTGNAARSPVMAIAWRERNRFDNTIRYEDSATQAPEATQEPFFGQPKAIILLAAKTFDYL
jgi:hypothetical protein